MSKIQPFTFPATGQAVRTVTIDGEPWFIGRDVAAVLGYANPTRDVVRHTSDRQRRQYRIGTPSGEQLMTVVSEPGVYRLVMRSNLPAAEAFQDWIAEDVIPSIRRTGSYSVQPVVRLPDITTPEGVLAMAEQFAETARALVVAEARVTEMEPKALAHDTYLSAGKGDRLVRQVAKLLGWREKDLRAFLLEERLIFARQALCGRNQYDVYADHVQHIRPVEKVVQHTWGPCSHYTLYIRPPGVDLIQRRIARQKAAIQRSIGGV